MAKRPKRLFQIVPAFGEMGPSIGVDRDDRGACEGSGGLDCIVCVHGEIELAPRLRGSAEEQHKTRFKSPLHFGHAIEPNRVACHIQRFEGVRFRRHDEADDIAGKGFYADRPMPGRRRGNVERTAVII